MTNPRLQAFGRAVWGLIADFWFQHRAAVLLCTMSLMTCGHIMLALAPTMLIAGTVVIGFAFGGMFAIAPVITSEQFGNRHFGTNWGCIVFAPAIGSVAFNALFGHHYETEIREGCDDCYGMNRPRQPPP